MQSSALPTRCTAFCRGKIIATGARPSVALAVRHALVSGNDPIAIIDDATGQEIDFDLRGSDDEIRQRLTPSEESAVPPKPGRGRPRLGVVPREVTLLPRHWDWLAQQPGGASAALRRLVDEARKSRLAIASARTGKDAAFRAMSALAGDLTGFEEAARALYANDSSRFDVMLQHWPPDIADYVRRLASTPTPDEGASKARPGS